MCEQLIEPSATSLHTFEFALLGSVNELLWKLRPVQLGVEVMYCMVAIIE